MVLLCRLSSVVPTLLEEQLVDTSFVGDFTLGSMTQCRSESPNVFYFLQGHGCLGSFFLYFENSRVKNLCPLVSQYFSLNWTLTIISA